MQESFESASDDLLRSLPNYPTGACYVAGAALAMGGRWRSRLRRFLLEFRCPIYSGSSRPSISDLRATEMSRGAFHTRAPSGKWA